MNRMKSNSQRGRSIANDSSVQSLFNVITNMHPQLMKYTQEQEDMRGRVTTDSSGEAMFQVTFDLILTIYFMYIFLLYK